jgi:hypothetical protein
MANNALGSSGVVFNRSSPDGRDIRQTLAFSSSGPHKLVNEDGACKTARACEWCASIQGDIIMHNEHLDRNAFRSRDFSRETKVEPVASVVLYYQQGSAFPRDRLDRSNNGVGIR